MQAQTEENAGRTFRNRNYLERELTNLQLLRAPDTVRHEYDNGQVVAITGSDVIVNWGEVTVADLDDRFIPRGDAIYAYSRRGSEREWVLPEKYRRKTLEVFPLSKAGRGPSHKVECDTRIRLKLDPRAPVKIIAAKK